MKRALLISLGLVALTSSLVTADRGGRRGRWNGHHGNGGQHHQRPPIDLGHLQTITTACQNAFEGNANEQTCVATITQSRTRFDAPSMIAACEAAFDGDANEQSCLSIAVGSWQEPSPIITACEAAFDGDANELTCIRSLASSWLTAPAVTACESAFDGDANEQACLNALVGTRYDAAQLVAYCEQNHDGDANELACIGEFR